MWETKLEELKEEKKIYGEEINFGASEELLMKFINAVSNEIQTELPNGYLDVLKKVNGLEFNGFILYGIDEKLLEAKPNQQINGLIDLNQVWYENEEQKQFLFLGESSISWYVFEIKKKLFLELDNPSGRESMRFNSFDEMFEKFLSDALM